MAIPAIMAIFGDSQEAGWPIAKLPIAICSMGKLSTIVGQPHHHWSSNAFLF
jgi:hypothetical protein